MKFVDIPAEDAHLRVAILEGIGRVVAQGDFILGAEVAEFESAMCRYLGVRHCIAVASGTDALVLALRALELPKGSEVITTPFTFFATTQSILNEGLVPVFADIDPVTHNIDPQSVAQRITSRTRAILPVHLFGRPARMDVLMELAKKHDLKVVEDCAQSLGATLDGRHAGTFGIAGCYSFYPTKNLGAYGDAGMLATDDESLAQRVRLIRGSGASSPYRHARVGINSRCDTLQAVVLKAKLPGLDRLNARRRENAARYRAALGDLGALSLPPEEPGGVHVFHQFTVEAQNRAALREGLQRRGIPTQVYYEVPMHLQEVIVSLGHRRGSLPTVERAAERVLSLPISPSHDEAAIDSVCRAVRELLGR